MDQPLRWIASQPPSPLQNADAEPLPESVEGLKERPEARNLVDIYAAFAGSSAEAVLGEFGGRGFGTFKPALAERIVAELGPVATRMRDLLADRAELDRILGSGAERARAIAAPILKETQQIVGFLG